MSEGKGGSGGIFMAFLAGGLIGAGLALLYAPAPGRETREKISNMAEDMKKKSGKWTSDVKQKVGGLVEEERTALKAAYEAGREAMLREKARLADAKPGTE